MTLRAPTGALLAVATAFACLAGQPRPHADSAPDRRPVPLATRGEPAMDGIRIRLANGETVSAKLQGGEAARAFRALLPLRLVLTDYNRTEKIADLPSRLATRGEPDGIDPVPGDLAYYAPWGNLALFYKDFGYSRGLVRLGRLDRVPDAFRQPGSMTVTIEAAP